MREPQRQCRRAFLTYSCSSLAPSGPLAQTRRPAELMCFPITELGGERGCAFRSAKAGHGLGPFRFCFLKKRQPLINPVGTGPAARRLSHTRLHTGAQNDPVLDLEAPKALRRPTTTERDGRRETLRSTRFHLSTRGARSGGDGLPWFRPPCSIVTR